MWIFADNINRNVNSFCSIKENWNDIKWNGFLKEKNADFNSNGIWVNNDWSLNVFK